jgi:hypothetical protein
MTTQLLCGCLILLWFVWLNIKRYTPKETQAELLRVTIAAAVVGGALFGWLINVVIRLFK